MARVEHQRKQGSKTGLCSVCSEFSILCFFFPLALRRFRCIIAPRVDSHRSLLLSSLHCSIKIVSHSRHTLHSRFE